MQFFGIDKSMKTLITIITIFATSFAYAGGDYLITNTGQKVEAWKLRVNKNNFQVKFRDRTTKVYPRSEVLSYYNSENDVYYEKLDLKERPLFLKVILTDGLHKIVSHQQEVQYVGGKVIFEELYYYQDKEMVSAYNKENHMRILRQFDVCPAFSTYVNARRRCYRKNRKLNEILKSQCQGAF